MQAHVKTPRIKIDIEGEIPPKVLSVLEEIYGKQVLLTEDEEYVDVFETEWYKRTSATVTPAEACAYTARTPK
jgi:hypothetical protein